MGAKITVLKNKIEAAVKGAGDEAQKNKTEAFKKITKIMEILSNKRDTFTNRIIQTRGNGIGATREIQGGRTVSRVSEMRCCSTSGADPGIKQAIGSFFKIAQGGDTAKKSAVEGAQKLLMSGLDALFGNSTASSSSREGFVCLFLNFAFVRIDFMVYSYNASGQKWGAKAFESGSVYVADIAVLDAGNDLRPSEVDFLLGQALQTDPAPSEEGEEKGEEATQRDIKAIQKLKIQLAQSVLLSQKLQDPRLKIGDLEKLSNSMLKASQSIKDGFSELQDFPEEEEKEITKEDLAKEFVEKTTS